MKLRSGKALTSRIRYVLTWIAMAVLLICSLCLVAIAWNRSHSGTTSSFVLILFWLGLCTSGIYLFMLAVKKAHRLMVDEERSQKDEGTLATKTQEKKDIKKDSQALDFSAMARKLIRRAPENASLEDVCKGVMKNLARELEIMSGLVYIRKKNQFELVSSYAAAYSSEPYTFKEGEGLSGQVARNQQILVLTRLPEAYMDVYSGLGKARPAYLAIIPLIHKNKTVAVLECSGYKYDPHEIENMFRIFSRDLMDKISPNLSA